MNIHQTSKITTIIGLIFEGLGLFGIAMVATIFNVFQSDIMVELMAGEMTPMEMEFINHIFGIFKVLFVVMGFILFVFFIVNLILFTKLLQGKFNKQQAQNVLLYQAIYGGISLLSNQIVGVLYLVSGIQGRAAIQKENQPIREGL